MFTAIRGRTVYYESRGEGPPIVFVHGLGGSSAVWYTQAQELSSNFRTIVFDWFGSGHSAKPHAEYSVEQWGEQTKNLCEELGVSRIGLVGHSLGAAVAVRVAACHPNLVRSLALLAPVTALEEPGIATIRERIRRVRSNGMTDVAEAVAAGALAPRTRETNPVIYALYRAMLLANDPECYALHCEALLRTNVETLIPQVGCPVLLLAGDSDRTAPPEEVNKLAGKFGSARVVEIPNGGHAMQLDRPGTVGRALAEFFTETLAS